MDSDGAGYVLVQAGLKSEESPKSELALYQGLLFLALVLTHREEGYSELEGTWKQNVRHERRDPGKPASPRKTVHNFSSFLRF